MRTADLTDTCGMLILYPGGLAQCAACGWEGIPIGDSTHCPACEREDDSILSAELDAEAARHSRPKVGRNEPCPCGSGAKAKRCCYR